jgi:hypothetical protein
VAQSTDRAWQYTRELKKYTYLSQWFLELYKITKWIKSQASFTKAIKEFQSEGKKQPNRKPWCQKRLQKK